jgi:hypothetical protein
VNSHDFSTAIPGLPQLHLHRIAVTYLRCYLSRHLHYPPDSTNIESLLSSRTIYLSSNRQTLSRAVNFRSPQRIPSTPFTEFQYLTFIYIHLLTFAYQHTHTYTEFKTISTLQSKQDSYLTFTVYVCLPIHHHLHFTYNL